MGEGVVLYLTRSPLELAPKEKVLKLDSEHLNNIVNIRNFTERQFKW